MVLILEFDVAVGHKDSNNSKPNEPFISRIEDFPWRVHFHAKVQSTLVTSRNQYQVLLIVYK